MKFDREQYLLKIKCLTHQEIKELVEKHLGIWIFDDCDEDDYERLREVLLGERTLKSWVAETYFEDVGEVIFFNWIELIKDALKECNIKYDPIKNCKTCYHFKYCLKYNKSK
jgi:hypothetical protein